MERNILGLNNIELTEIIKENSIDTVILPVGTIEAHGIVPLGTDVIIPNKISQDIAGDLNALIAPAVPYGLTGGLLPYNGSMTLTKATFENLLFEISVSFKKTGFKKIVINNGHGGNMASLKNVAERVYRETGLFVVIVHWWIHCADLSEEIFKKTGGHAAVDETAMIQAVCPELVRWEYSAKISKYCPHKGIDSIPVPSTVIVYDESGGDPVNDPELSRKFYDSVVKRVSQTVLEVLKNIDFWVSLNLLS